MLFRADVFLPVSHFGEEKEQEIRVRTTKHKITIKSGRKARAVGFLVTKKWEKGQKSLFLHV